MGVSHLDIFIAKRKEWKWKQIYRSNPCNLSFTRMTSIELTGKSFLTDVGLYINGLQPPVLDLFISALTKSLDMAMWVQVRVRSLCLTKMISRLCWPMQKVSWPKKAKNSG